VKPGLDEAAAVAVLQRRTVAKGSPGAVVVVKANTIPDIGNLQLQHVNIAAALPFSDHSLRR
jgi:hypothetical protein